MVEISYQITSNNNSSSSNYSNNHNNSITNNTTTFSGITVSGKEEGYFKVEKLIKKIEPTLGLMNIIIYIYIYY